MTVATRIEAAGASRPLAAAAWMGGAILSFAAMAVAGREASAELDTFEIMFYRSAVGFPLVAALLWRVHGAAGLRTAQPGLHLLRNVVHFTAQNLWFFAIALIPLAQLVALEFTNPIWVALLAPLLLGERLSGAKMVAALVGFAGVLVIAQPGVAPIEIGHLAALASALGFALTNIMTRRLTRADPVLCVLFWMTLSQMLMGLVCALPGGVTLFSWKLAPWILFIGLSGLGAHLSLTRALSLAPASVVAPMEFLRLPVVAVLGLILYGEPIQISLAVGAALILAGNMLNIREARVGAR
jgi:drug/metabolite transporter (DMT)-like permease